MKLIRNVLRSIIRRILPELNHLNNPGSNVNIFKSIKHKTILGQKVKVYSPHSLSQVVIGTGSYLAQNAIVSKTTIGKYCSIGPNLICGWGIHPTDYISTSPYFYSSGKQNGHSLVNETVFEERQPIVIGNDVFIGANVTILDGVTIGDGAVIGAGAVVSKDIPPYAIAVGVPIEVIKYRFSQDVIDKLLVLKWWDLGEDVHQLMVKYKSDVEQFLEEVGTL